MSSAGQPRRTLLSIVELGGYPNLTPLYKQFGYEVLVVPSVRKALSTIKTSPPAVVVAEFNFQSDFRDRTSSLESLLAVLQRHSHIKVIVFYEPEYSHQLDKLRARFNLFETLAFPIQADQLRKCLERI